MAEKQQVTAMRLLKLAAAVFIAAFIIMYLVIVMGPGRAGLERAWGPGDAHAR